MVRLIDFKYQAQPARAPILEVNVYEDPTGQILATLDIQDTKSSRRIGPNEFLYSLPAADAFLQALAYAERDSIPYVCVRDPRGLFPPASRPVRDVQSSR